MEGTTNAFMQPEAGADFNTDLFAEFISWIDRSEKTARSYVINLRQFMAWMRYAGVTNPTRQDITDYRDWLASEHKAISLDPATRYGWRYRTDKRGNMITITCKPNTVTAYLRIVCQFFRWTAASGLYPDITANIHAPKLKSDTHRKEALTPQEVLQVEESIIERGKEREAAAAAGAKDREGRIQRAAEQSKRLKAMYLLTVNAGLRTVEISRANVRDIETKGGQAWFYIWGKGHSEPDQKKALAPEVAEAVKDYLRARADRPAGYSPLFVGTGNRSGGKRLAATTASTMLKRAMQEAGYDSERLTAHSLRHSTGTAVQELTGDIYATQMYMRHRSPATTEIYLHNETEKRDACIAQELYNYFHGSGRGQSLEELLGRLNTEQRKQVERMVQAIVMN